MKEIILSENTQVSLKKLICSNVAIIFSKQIINRLATKENIYAESKQTLTNNIVYIYIYIYIYIYLHDRGHNCTNTLRKNWSPRQACKRRESTGGHKCSHTRRNSKSYFDGFCCYSCCIFCRSRWSVQSSCANLGTPC